MNKKKRKNGKVGKVVKTTLSGIAALLLLGGAIGANNITAGYQKMGNDMIGGRSKIDWDNKNVNTKGLDLQYTKTKYTKDSIKKVQNKMSYDLAGQGTVLLKNDDHVMPFNSNTKFSIFSVNSVPRKQGSGLLGLIGGKSLDLGSLFKQSGFKVNDTLTKFYQSKSNKKYGLASGSIGFGVAEDFSINEVPFSKIYHNKKVIQSLKGTVPVYFLKRVAGEGRDMPRSMASHAKSNVDRKKSYLDIDSNEEKTIKYLNDHFKDVVLLINSNAALNLNWVKKYPNVKAILFAPKLNKGVTDIFSGKVNPSGRTVDTFAVNALKSPAAQNIGDYQYRDKNGKLTKYNYVTYGENIYVGYRYYETRYEDKKLNQGNPGNYEYNKEVVYPFGYGLSYTKFKWSDFKVKPENDHFKVNVTVKNVGNRNGRDVVESYFQSPYTSYDKQNNVEKPSIELAAYAKTKELKPNETQTITMTINRSQLRAYDEKKAKTYIFEPGKYYITAARNAHDAINNVLAKKATTTSGDKKDVFTWSPKLSKVDATTYSRATAHTEKINNQFTYARGNYKYLTRKNWVGSFPKHDGVISKQISTWGNEANGRKNGKVVSYTWTKTASPALLEKLNSFNSLNPKIKGFTQKPVYNRKNNLKLISLRGKAYNDPLWNKLLDEISPEEYKTLISSSGYGVDEMKSVGKPFNLDADSATGLLYGGTGDLAMGSPISLAQSYDKKLAYRYGRIIGDQALIGGATGWYAPSMDIHRTPFGGRNGEYLSEDPYLTGKQIQNEVRGVAQKGMYVYMKHFALNEQENHRGDTNGQFGLATWANEQAIREIYLRPFEMCAHAGNVRLNYVAKKNGKFVNVHKQYPAVTGVMTSFNRIGATWAGGNYNLLTNVLRKEWGFKGAVITDNANTSKYMDGNQMIQAGGDMLLVNAQPPLVFKYNKNDPNQYHFARQAAHNVLFMTANSKAMNGAMPGSILKTHMTKIKKIIWAYNIIAIILIALMAWFTYRRFTKDKKAK